MIFIIYTLKYYILWYYILYVFIEIIMLFKKYIINNSIYRKKKKILKLSLKHINL